jgi:hypothetical protein
MRGGGYMLYLSDATLKCVLSRCIKRSGYKVGIAPLNRYKIKNKLVDMIDDDIFNHIYRMTFSINNTCIRFCNGSEIQIIQSNDSARGRAFHLIVVDKKIDKQTINCVLKKCEKLVDEYTKHYNQKLRKE